GEYESDVRVITLSAYRANGAGYRDPLHPSHLWTVEVPAAAAASLPEPRQVTRGDREEVDPLWSTDGTTLYFRSNPAADPAYLGPRSELYAVPRGGGEIVKAVDLGGQVHDAVPSPDGKRLALVGEPHGDTVRSYNLPVLFVVDRAPGGAWSPPR